MEPESNAASGRDGGPRMTIGEHLDELRGCLVRCFLAFFVACFLCIWPAKYVLEWLARPMVLALRRHDMPHTFLATGPVETLLIYVKVVVVTAAIISGPYIIFKLWEFVAVGLYPREKKWIYKLVPISVGLFFVGVIFMYLFVLLLSLNFLVGFSAWLPQPDPVPTALERQLLGDKPPTLPDGPAVIEDTPRAVVLAKDPNDPPLGAIWFNLLDNKLKLKGVDETYAVQFLRDDRRAMVENHFRIGEYLSFVLALTLAFGLAFQMPLVVVFLGRSGIVPTDVMRKYRRVVILVIVVIAAFIAPPDLMSHIFLSAPMIVLFEIGLRFADRKREPDRAA